MLPHRTIEARRFRIALGVTAAGALAAAAPAGSPLACADNAIGMRTARRSSCERRPMRFEKVNTVAAV